MASRPGRLPAALACTSSSTSRWRGRRTRQPWSWASGASPTVSCTGAPARSAPACGSGASVRTCRSHRMDASLELIGRCSACWRPRRYLPIETDTPRARLAEMIADAGPRSACAAGPRAENGRHSRVRSHRARRRRRPRPAAAAAGRADTRPDHLVAVYYTSGSTGRPKGSPALTAAGSTVCGGAALPSAEARRSVLHKTR